MWSKGRGQSVGDGGNGDKREEKDKRALTVKVRYFSARVSRWHGWLAACAAVTQVQLFFKIRYPQKLFVEVWERYKEGTIRLDPVNVSLRDFDTASCRVEAGLAALQNWTCESPIVFYGYTTFTEKVWAQDYCELRFWFFAEASHNFVEHK